MYDFNTDEVWQELTEYLDDYVHSYRYRNSAGQKSGVFFINDETEAKIVIDLHFYDDTSITNYNVFTERNIQNFINKDFFKTMMPIIIKQMFDSMLPAIAHKEKEYETYLFQQRLGRDLPIKQKQTRGMKV